MALPLRSKNPPETFPFATIAIIVANVVVFLFTSKGFLVGNEDILRHWGVSLANFSPVTLFTSMFLHADIFHILFNMWAFVIFGTAIEGRLRWYRFVPLYLIAGCVGGGLHLLVFGRLHPELPLIGASGAIMGVMGAALWTFPYAKVQVLSRWNRYGGGSDSWVFPVADWPMYGVAAYFVGLDLLYSFLFGGRDGTAHLAHLGGVAAGFLLCVAFRPHRDSEMASESKATLAEVKDLAVLSRMELAELHLGNPSDPLIVLHWMDKSLRDPKGPNQACVDAFFKLMPRMRKEMDPRTLAAPFVALSGQGLVKAREMVSLAGDLERATDNVNALRLYETAYGAADATEAEQETACFRTGLLCENVMHAPDRAAACYGEVLHRWPMGPFAQQAKVRLTGIEGRTRAKV